MESCVRAIYKGEECGDDETGRLEGEEWGVVANDAYRSGQVNETPVTETKQDEPVDENNNESADDWAEEEEEASGGCRE